MWTRLPAPRGSRSRRGHKIGRGAPAPRPRSAPPKVTAVVPERPGGLPGSGPPPPPPPSARPGVGSPRRVEIPETRGSKLRLPAAEPPKVKPVVPKRPAAAAPAAPGPPKRKTVVEVPPLELEPDFDTAITEAGHDVDDEPLAVEDIPPTGRFIQTEDDTSGSETRKSAFIDLGLDSVVNQGDTSASLVFTNIEATPTPPTTEELEARVADDPDDPEAHQALGEALIEAGERGRGVEGR